MSDSVPCRQPYEPRLPRAESGTIVLHVGRGSEVEGITASVKLLRCESEYFYDRLANRESDMSHLPLAFPSESPAIFNVFISFLSTGELRHSNLRSTSRVAIALNFLVELFEFSADFSATTFRNAVLDAFFLRLESSSRRLKLHDFPVRDIYESTGPNSSLRDMLVTVIVNTGNMRDVEKCEDELPKAFLMDCLRIAAEDKTVPFDKSRREAKAWLGKKMERICEEYHVHDEQEEDDGMVDDDMPGGIDDNGRDDDKDRGGGDSRDQASPGVSEKTQQELAVVEEMRKLRIGC